MEALSKHQDPDFIEDNEGTLSHNSADKIEVSINAVGRAPKLKVNKFKLKKSHTFQNLITFIRG